MSLGKRFFKYLLIFFFSGLIFLFIAYLFTIPSTAWLKHKNPELTSLMNYRLKKASPGYHIRKKWVPLSEISPYLIKAVLIAEDDRFYMHEGFDIEGIKEAIRKDIKKGKFVAGGSTITQQLAKNLFLTPERTITRKMKEAIIAWKLERTLSKKRILELYLNVVEWGPGVFGAEAAANYYFGKSSRELTPEEAARLAVVLPNPIRYNPLSGSRYVENRAAFVLEIMRKRGIIPPEYGLEKGSSDTEEQNLMDHPQEEKIQEIRE
ncbi:MAG: monofunctional biosynthetic peptidoglycan transglycosylase [Thermodesulfovibrionales bacterium]|nr:monofunctional biosynthetic peptidoglycan transglycosylase [Thermodesulfovibrionales bacterium]